MSSKYGSECTLDIPSSKEPQITTPLVHKTSSKRVYVGLCFCIVSTLLLLSFSLFLMMYFGVLNINYKHESVINKFDAQKGNINAPKLTKKEEDDIDNDDINDNGYNNCFSSESMVYRYNNINNKIESILLKNTNKGDLLMSNLNGEFSELLFDLFENEINKILMNKICFDNNSCLILGNNHLIFAITSNGININNVIPSKYLNIGDSIHHINDKFDDKVCYV